MTTHTFFKPLRKLWRRDEAEEVLTQAVEQAAQKADQEKSQQKQSPFRPKKT